MPLNFNSIAESGIDNGIPISLDSRYGSAPVITDAVQYVSITGKDTNTGFSWGKAKLTVAAAVAALPFGGTIMVGAGVFVCPAPNSLFSYTTIQGQGMGVTTLRVDANHWSAFNNSFLIQAAAGATNCHIRDLTLDGNRRAGGGPVNTGGLITMGSGWSADRVELYDGNWFKFFILNATRVRIRDCVFDANLSGYDNIGGGGTNVDVLVDGCYYAVGNLGNALDLTGGSNIRFTNNYVEQGSVYYEAITGGIINGNIVRGGGITLQSDTAYGPATATNPRDIRVTNNMVEGINADIIAGITLRYDSNGGVFTSGGGNIIASNDVRNVRAWGILKHTNNTTPYSVQTKGDVITGNVVRNTNLAGTGTTNTGYCTIFNAGVAIDVAAGDIISNNIVDDDQLVPTTLVGMVLGGSNAVPLPDTIIANNALSTIATPLSVTNPAYLTGKTTLTNNTGYNPQGPAVIAVTGSPFTYTNTDSVRELIYITGGTISSIQAGGGLFPFAATSAAMTLELAPRESVTVTYTVAPTMYKDRK